MRHRKSAVKLNRTSSHRKAMFRNMVTSLLKHDRIRTTDVKAKALRSWADHLVTLAKRGDLHARRQALSIVPEKDVVHKLFEEANERFGDRSGGYTRIVKIGYRPGDAAPMCIIELVSMEKAKKKKGSKQKTKPAGRPATPIDAAPEEPTAERPEAPEEQVSEADTKETAGETQMKADSQEAPPGVPPSEPSETEAAPEEKKTQAPE